MQNLPPISTDSLPFFWKLLQKNQSILDFLKEAIYKLLKYYLKLTSSVSLTILSSFS